MPHHVRPSLFRFNCTVQVQHVHIHTISTGYPLFPLQPAEYNNRIKGPKVKNVCVCVGLRLCISHQKAYVVLRPPSYLTSTFPNRYWEVGSALPHLWTFLVFKGWLLMTLYLTSETHDQI